MGKTESDRQAWEIIWPTDRHGKQWDWDTGTGKCKMDRDTLQWPRWIDRHLKEQDGETGKEELRGIGKQDMMDRQTGKVLNRYKKTKCKWSVDNDSKCYY